jgi:DNA-binding transcriptional LysR family regulator
MARMMQWERRLGRRLRLRDLSVFFTVAECRGIGKAAEQLGVSTPSVSEAIADLEHALGARLFDRNAKGVTLTSHGEVVLQRGRAAFDELRGAVQEIEALADPEAGDVRVGCSESLAALLGLIIEEMAERYPNIRFSVQQVRWPSTDFPELRDRTVDLVLSRNAHLERGGRANSDLNVDLLLNDPFSIVVGRKSKWGRRSKVDLADLADARWILTPLDVIAGRLVAESFAERGLPVPTPYVATSSIFLRSYLASAGDFVVALPRSVLLKSADLYGLKELPIKLSSKVFPVSAVTLKNRTLPPAVRTFIKCAREVSGRFK